MQTLMGLGDPVALHHNPAVRAALRTVATAVVAECAWCYGSPAGSLALSTFATHGIVP